MIATVFTLSFGLLLLVQVGVTDVLLLIREAMHDVESAVGHDTQVFPDTITLHLPTIHTS